MTLPLIFLIGTLVMAMVIILAWPKKETMVLSDAYKVDDLKDLIPDTTSVEYKLAAGNVNMQPVTFKTIRIGVALLGFVGGFWLVGPVVAVVLGGLGYYFPTTWLNDKALSRGLEIDKHLPVAVGRVASALLAGASIADALLETAESLDIQGRNPLSPEFRQSAADINSKSKDEGLFALAERSPSISLSNFAMMLQGQGSSGGSAYALALMDISQRVQGIIEARNRAKAKSQETMATVVAIPGLLIMMIVFMSADPVISKSLHSFAMQIILAVTALMMVVGYFVMQNMIKEAV